MSFASVLLTRVRPHYPSQSTMAQVVGRDQSRISAWLQGRSVPPVREQRRILEAYGLAWADVLDELAEEGGASYPSADAAIADDPELNEEQRQALLRQLADYRKSHGAQAHMRRSQA